MALMLCVLTNRYDRGCADIAQAGEAPCRAQSFPQSPGKASGTHRDEKVSGESVTPCCFGDDAVFHSISWSEGAMIRPPAPCTPEAGMISNEPITGR